MDGFNAQQPAGYSETYTEHERKERERGTLSPGKRQENPYIPPVPPSAPPVPAYNQPGFRVDFETTPYTLPRTYSTVTTNQAMPARTSSPEATGVSRAMSGESLKAYEARAIKIAEEICQCRTAILRLFINEDDETLRELVDLIRKSEEEGADLPSAAEKIRTGVSKENRDENGAAFVLKSTPKLLDEPKADAMRDALRDFPNDITENTRTIILTLVEAILSREAELEAISSQAAALRKYVEQKAAQTAKVKPGLTEATLALADCLKRHAELKEMISLYDFPVGENRNTIFKEFEELTEKIEELKQIILLNDAGTSTRTLEPRQIAGIERHQLTKRQSKLAQIKKKNPLELQPASEEEYDGECGKSKNEIRRSRSQKVDQAVKTFGVDLRRHSFEQGQSPKAHDRAVSKAKRERKYARQAKVYDEPVKKNSDDLMQNQIDAYMERDKLMAQVRELKSEIRMLESEKGKLFVAFQKAESALAKYHRKTWWEKKHTDIQPIAEAFRKASLEYDIFIEARQEKSRLLLALEMEIEKLEANFSQLRLHPPAELRSDREVFFVGRYPDEDSTSQQNSWPPAMPN